MIELLETYKKQAMTYLITHKVNNVELPKDLLEFLSNLKGKENETKIKRHAGS